MATSAQWALMVSEPLFEWRARSVVAVNPAARAFGELNIRDWGGLGHLAGLFGGGLDGPACLKIISDSQGVRILELMTVNGEHFFKLTGAGVSRDYLVLRDNLLSMLNREFQVPLKTLSASAQALKTSAIQSPEVLALVDQWLAPATQSIALMPAILDLARLYGHESLDAEERIVFSELLPALIEGVSTADVASRGVRVDLSTGEKPLGAMYGPSYWVEAALRGLLGDVVAHAAENTDVRIVARQMPYMLNLVFRVVGGIGQRGIDLSVLDERPLIAVDGSVSVDRVRLNLAYAVLKRIGGNFKFKSSALGVEYIVEIPTGQGMNACAETRAKTASEQAEQYARDMAMLMEAVSRRKS